MKSAGRWRSGADAELVGLFDPFTTCDSLNTICKHEGTYLLRHGKHLWHYLNRGPVIFAKTGNWDLSVRSTVEMNKTLLSWGWVWGDPGQLRQPNQTPRRECLVSKGSPGFFPGPPDPSVFFHWQPWVGVLLTSGSEWHGRNKEVTEESEGKPQSHRPTK